MNGEFISATDVIALASKLDIDCLSCQTHLFDTAIVILVKSGYTVGMYKDTLVITNRQSVVLNSDLLQTIDRLKKQVAELEAENAVLKEAQRWRQAESEPPEEDGDYLTRIEEKIGGRLGTRISWFCILDNKGE